MTAAKTQNDLEAALAENRRARAQEEADSVPKSEVHTYADGSQRVGVPPFPEKSPIEEDAEEKRKATPMNVPAGMKQSGEPAPAAPGGVDLDALEARATEQLTSDVLSGKDPHTPNPTTASDKPQLAGETGVVTADQLESGAVTAAAEPTAEELATIAAQIEPKGELDATDEQKAAAVAQVARETKGVVGAAAADTKTAKGKK
jgi:hypothetical protein